MKRLKHITVRMIPRPGYTEDSYTFHAPPGRHYTDAQGVLDHVIEYLDKKFPWWDFKIVQVGPGKYNFMYAGLRDTPRETPEPEDLTRYEESRRGE